MGGCCCCSSKRVEWNTSPQFYHYPVISDERLPLSSHGGAASAFPRGLLVDTNLETSIPDTYRPPPAPIPYDANAGHARRPLNNQEGCGNKGQAPVQERLGEISSNSGECLAKEANESNCKEQSNIKPVATKEVDAELEKSDELKKSSAPFLAPEECPTCLEEYDEENPKIITKCEHHFHLSCILEWMERSDSCPVCDKEMILNFPLDK